MYVRHALGFTGLGACAVPTGVTVRKLVLTTADRGLIGAELGLTRAATTAEVRKVITDAVQRAVVLIGRAADPLRHPRATGTAAEPMRLRFRDAFGTMPDFVPAWRPAGATWDRGAVVRERLRCAAKIMSEGDIEYMAWGPRSCPFRFPMTAWAGAQPGRYRICLGPPFWQASRRGDVNGMATTLLHECLHIYFDTLRHELERGSYNRAACYERYVLMANDLPVPDDVAGPCPWGAPIGDFPMRAPGSRAAAGLGSIGQPATISCAPEPGEIVASRTNAGILTKDVELTGKGVLVTDFGVARGSVKPGARAELAPTLARLENDASIKTIRITGFDDCLKASPQEHRHYRKRRAMKMLALLGPKARAKVTFAGGAPLGTFIGPNTDRAARARNRSVLIEYVTVQGQPRPVDPDVKVKPPYRITDQDTSKPTPKEEEKDRRVIDIPSPVVRPKWPPRPRYEPNPGKIIDGARRLLEFLERTNQQPEFAKRLKQALSVAAGAWAGVSVIAGILIWTGKAIVVDSGAILHLAQSKALAMLDRVGRIVELQRALGNLERVLDDGDALNPEQSQTPPAQPLITVKPTVRGDAVEHFHIPRLEKDGYVGLPNNFPAVDAIRGDYEAVRKDGKIIKLYKKPDVVSIKSTYVTNKGDLLTRFRSDYLPPLQQQAFDRTLENVRVQGFGRRELHLIFEEGALSTLTPKELRDVQEAMKTMAAESKQSGIGFKWFAFTSGKEVSGPELMEQLKLSTE